MRDIIVTDWPNSMGLVNCVTLTQFVFARAIGDNMCKYALRGYGIAQGRHKEGRKHIRHLSLMRLCCLFFLQRDTKQCSNAAMVKCTLRLLVVLVNNTLRVLSTSWYCTIVWHLFGDKQALKFHETSAPYCRVTMLGF